MLTTMEGFDAAVLTEMITLAQILGADVKAGLFTNVVNPSKTKIVADFTEPLYASYVRQNIVFGAPFRDPANGIAALAASLLWQQTGSPTPVTIQGIFYVYGAGSTALLGMENFQTPISLNDLLDAFSTVFEFIQSNDNAGFTTIVR